MVGDIINEKDVWLGKNYNFHQPEWAGYQQFTLGFNTKQIQEVHTIFFKKTHLSCKILEQILCYNQAEESSVHARGRDKATTWCTIEHTKFPR